MGQWVTHGSWVNSNGSTDLDGSHGSWVSIRDPLTHEAISLVFEGYKNKLHVNVIC